MPGDRLAFAIGVGGEVDFFGALGGRFQFLYNGPLVIGHAVFRFKVVLDVDRQPALQQIAHVAHGGHDRVTIAEITADAARFGGRFDDDQFSDISGVWRLSSRGTSFFSSAWLCVWLSSVSGAQSSPAWGCLSWAAVAPMRNSFVPHSPHCPRVPGVPVLV